MGAVGAQGQAAVSTALVCFTAPSFHFAARPQHAHCSLHEGRSRAHAPAVDTASRSVDVKAWMRSGTGVVVLSMLSSQRLG